MFSIGWKRISFFLALFACFNVFAQYSLPGGTTADEAGINNSEEGSVFAEGTYTDRPMEEPSDVDPSSVHVQGSTSAKPYDGAPQTNTYGLPNYQGQGFAEPTEKQKILGMTDSALPGKGLDHSGFLEIKNRDIFKRIYNKSSESFSFSYIMDNYDFQDGQNTFKKTYEDSTGSVKGGSVHLSFDKYFSSGAVRFAWGGNVGVGFNQGRGYFSTGEESDTVFNLWTLPLDASVTMEMAMGKVMKLALTGGPSVMGLMQSRNDKDDSEDKKRRNQFSYGYFGGAKAKISISNLSSSTAFEMFKSYDVTNFFLNLEMRYQNYANFQEENLTISGMSFGLGFTFEYL